MTCFLSPASNVVLRFIQVTALQLLLLVFEDRHSGLHAQEAELHVEGLLAGYCVEDDLLVSTRHLYEIDNDLLAETDALVAGQDCNVADVRAVRSISQCPTRANQASVIVHKALEHA